MATNSGKQNKIHYFIYKLLNKFTKVYVTLILCSINNLSMTFFADLNSARNKLDGLLKELSEKSDERPVCKFKLFYNFLITVVWISLLDL